MRNFVRAPGKGELGGATGCAIPLLVLLVFVALGPPVTDFSGRSSSSGQESAATAKTAEVGKTPKPLLAMLDFTSENVPANEIEAICNTLWLRLYERKKMTLMLRAGTRFALSQWRLLPDRPHLPPSSYGRIGRALGVDHVVFGHVSRSNGAYALDVSLFSVRQGKTIVAKTEVFDKGLEQMLAEMGKLADVLFSPPPLVLPAVPSVAPTEVAFVGPPGKPPAAPFALPTSLALERPRLPERTPAPRATPPQVPRPTPTPTLAPTPRLAPQPTPRPTPIVRPKPEIQPTPAPPPSVTAVATPRPTPTPIPEPILLPTPRPTPLRTPEPTPTPAPQPTPTPTPRPTPEPTPTPRPTPTPTPEPPLKPPLEPTQEPTTKPISEVPLQPTTALVAAPTPTPTPSPKPVLKDLATSEVALAPKPTPAASGLDAKSPIMRAKDLYDRARALLARDERSSEALKLLTAAVELDSANIQYRYRLARSYYFNNDWQNAVAQCNEVVTRSPRYIDALTIMGLSHAKMDNYPKAIEAYEQALVIDPTNLYAQFNLAAACEYVDRARARAEWQRYIELAQNDPTQKEYVEKAKNSLKALE